VLVLWACASVPEITFTDADAATLAAEAGSAMDTGVVGDGAVVTPDGNVIACTKTEICDDGIDNDCNGMTDCADPMCSSFACVDAPPTGWALVALAETTQPACPTGYTASTDLKVVSGAVAHTCSCSCAATGGTSCTSASVAVATSGENTCMADTSTNINNNVGATCTALAADLDIPMGTDFAKLATPGGPTSCNNTPTLTKLNPTDGRACTPPMRGGSGCAASTQTCLLKPAGFTMCVSKAGNQACPAGFTKQRHAGSAATDSRMCSACTCNNAPCASDVVLWSNGACNAKMAHLTTANNTSCSAPLAGSDMNFTAKYYKSTTTGGCSVGTAPTPQGMLTFTDERTICCN
jgi:hypothetical protein